MPEALGKVGQSLGYVCLMVGMTFPGGCKLGAERLLQHAGDIMNLAIMVIMWQYCGNSVVIKNCLLPRAFYL